MEASATSERTRELEARIEALQRFKDFCHTWLDSVGVPHDPDPAGNAEHGCRISGRMRWLLQQREEAVAACRTANEVLRNYYGERPKRNAEFEIAIEATADAIAAIRARGGDKP